MEANNDTKDLKRHKNYRNIPMPEEWSTAKLLKTVTDKCCSQQRKIQRISESYVTDKHSQKTVRKVSVALLILFKVVILEKQVSVPKENECNKKVVSKDFVERNRSILDIRKSKLIISHSSRKYSGVCDEVLYGTLVKISGHMYRNTWAISDTRHEVLLEMPWHVENNPTTI